MQEKLLKTRRRFVFSITALAALSVFAMGFALYETNLIKFDSELDSADLQSAVEDHPEVQEYLETEHQYEAHFLTIANIIKNDQQESLGKTMLVIIVPVMAGAALVGYFVAKRLLNPVREAYDAQERFLADAAHELRNPLATMSAVIQNASRKDASSSAELQKSMQQIRRQVGRMVRINEDLLYLERNVDTTTNVESNISELLTDVIEDLQPHATDRKLTFKLNVDQDITSDIGAKEFVRLSKNLIENAIKYSKPKSKSVIISLTKEKDKARLTVKDRGIGIPAEDLEQISERFFRASNVADLPGSGLGLAIVHKIAEQRGGKVEIDSELGKGTRVSVLM